MKGYKILSRIGQNSSDDDNDGFEENKIEIKSAKKPIFNQEKSDSLPEANPIYHRGGTMYVFNLLYYDSDERVRLLTKTISNSDSITIRQVQLNHIEKKAHQTLYDRYNQNDEYQLVYRRNEEDLKDQKQNINCIFKNPQQLQLKQFFLQRKNKQMFDSGFESGNLCAAYQVGDSSVFELQMQNDINTKGYTQWFNFCIHKMQPNQITIKIVNFLKQTSHFKNGMKPIVVTDQNNEYSPVPGVEILNLSYFKNNIMRKVVRRDDSFELKSYYTLQFDIKCTNKVKKLYISMNYPYTFEKLQQFLVDQKIQKSQITDTINIDRNTVSYFQLTKSLTGYICPYIIFTNSSSIVLQKKKVIIIARQHPGETVCSYVMEGVISFLQEDSIESQWLKDNVEFYIFPMINIDGVQAGNFRCDLTGSDLNRCWDRPNKVTQPVIYKLKKMIKEMISSQATIDFFIDLHGHSKKLNNFLYGCRNDADPVGCRLYPKIMELLCPLFKLEDCTFSISKHKIKTARAIVYQALKDREFNPKVINAFTLETSFYGYEKEDSVFQFTTRDLRSIGNDLINSLFVYWEGHIETQDLSSDQADRYNHLNIDVIKQELFLKREIFQEIDQRCGGGSDHEMQNSDSEAEIGQLTELEREKLITTNLPQQKQEQVIKKSTSFQQPKLKSKSVSNPDNNRQIKTAFLNDKELNTIKENEFNRTQITDKRNVSENQMNYKKLALISVVHPPKQQKSAIKSTTRQIDVPKYFNQKKRGINLQKVQQPSHIRVFDHQTNKQSSQIQEIDKQQGNFVPYVAAITPKEVIQNRSTIDNYFVNNILPAFQITRSYVKKQVQKKFIMSKLDKSKELSIIVPSQGYLKSNHKLQLESLPFQLSNSYEPQIQTQLQVEDNQVKKEQSFVQQQHMLSILKPKITHQKQNPVFSEDQMMTQLISEIWTMNQIKYGQQLKQPKQFKPVIKDDEDVRLFDDKKFQNSNRCFNQKRQSKAKNIDFDKLFPI